MPNDDEILYRPVLDDGTHLGDSHRTEGYKASTVYSDEDGSTVDIAEWEPVDLSDDDDNDDGLDELSVAIGTLIGVAATALAVFGISKAKPHVQRIIDEHIAPKASSIAQAVKRKIGIQKDATSESKELAGQQSEQEILEANTEGNESTITLSESEAEQLLMSAFHDYLIYAAKMRVIGNAQIVSNNQATAAKLEEAKAFLLSSEGLEKINLYLEAHPEWFTKQNAALFLELYDREPLKDGNYLPISDIEFEQTSFEESCDAYSLIKAHEGCTSNREKLKESDLCGCFYCLAIYNPSEIEEWIEDRNGDTAICPHCDIDAVLPESNDYPLSIAFLRRMQAYWFES